MIKLLLSTLFILFAGNIYSNSNIAILNDKQAEKNLVFVENSNQFKLVGESDFSVLFWDVYHIQLKTMEGVYIDGQLPLLLELTYQREIDKQDLVDETDNQWKRFNLQPSKKASWLNQLSQIWPNVKQNDKISFLITTEKNTQFFYNNSFIGEINEADFSEAFSKIWLDKKGPYPKMTLELLGQ